MRRLLIVLTLIALFAAGVTVALAQDATEIVDASDQTATATDTPDATPTPEVTAEPTVVPVVVVNVEVPPAEPADGLDYDKTVEELTGLVTLLLGQNADLTRFGGLLMLVLVVGQAIAPFTKTTKDDEFFAWLRGLVRGSAKAGAEDAFVDAKNDERLTRKAQAFNAQASGVTPPDKPA